MRAGLAASVDAALILVFATIGRRSHDEGLTLAGIAETAWPFLAGAASGWLLARYAVQLRPDSWQFGVVVIAAAVVIGMLLRRVTGQGTALAFIVVATAALSLLLLGWRVVAARLG